MPVIDYRQTNNKPKSTAPLTIVVVVVLIGLALLGDFILRAGQKFFWNEVSSVWAVVSSEIAKDQTGGKEDAWHNIRVPLREAQDYYKKKDFVKQERSAREILRLADEPSEEAVGYFWLANAQYHQSQFKEANESAQKAVDINPQFTSALVIVAQTQLEFGQFELGRQTAQRAVETDQSHAWAHNVLALAYLDLGMLDKAEKEFEIAVRLDPKDDRLQENLDRLRRMR